jgi:hypothetical protein
MTESPHDHVALAEALRRRVLDSPGETEPSLRQAVAARATGGAPISAPYDALAQQIGTAANGTTDAQVADVLAALHSQKAAFEIVATAAAAAGLERWQKGMAALKEAEDAP